jgi:hypothetical protein
MRRVAASRSAGLMAFVLALAGCDRGCARSWLADHGLGGPAPNAPGSMPLNAVDCPDGIARCEGGDVSASRLATLPMPCRGSANDCACPWDLIGECPSGCAAEGAEIVLERGSAVGQLCAPIPGARPFAMARPLPPPAASGSVVIDGAAGLEANCDEGDRYRCAGGRVVECASGQVVAACLRGCFVEGSSVDDDAVSREGASAILCSR